MQPTILLLALALLPQYLCQPQRERREAISTTTTHQPGSEVPTEVFYDYVVYTTTTPRPNEGSTPEPVPDGTTSQMKPMNPFVQVKRRSLLNDGKIVVKRQTSEVTAASTDTEPVAATEASDTTGAEETTDTAAADPAAVPEVTEAPEVPAAPVVSEAPEVPAAPVVSEAPEVPETPEVPEVPTAPVVPEAPEVPETPEVPEASPVAEPVAPVMPVEADTSVPGGMSSRAYIKRSISTLKEEADESSTDDDIPVTFPSNSDPNCEQNSNEEDKSVIIDQVNGSEDENMLAINSFARIVKVFVVQDILIGNQKVDILETFNKYKLRYFNENPKIIF